MLYTIHFAFISISYQHADYKESGEVKKEKQEEMKQLKLRVCVKKKPKMKQQTAI